jgi:hypothetical protein
MDREAAGVGAASIVEVEGAQEVGGSYRTARIRTWNEPAGLLNKELDIAKCARRLNRTKSCFLGLTKLKHGQRR